MDRTINEKDCAINNTPFPRITLQSPTDYLDFLQPFRIYIRHIEKSRSLQGGQRRDCQRCKFPTWVGSCYKRKEEKSGECVSVLYNPGWRHGISNGELSLLQSTIVSRRAPYSNVPGRNYKLLRILPEFLVHLR